MDINRRHRGNRILKWLLGLLALVQTQTKAYSWISRAEERCLRIRHGEALPMHSSTETDFVDGIFSINDSEDASFQDEEAYDNRPYVQRVKHPRPARRLNHAFKYLYRHDFVAETMPSDPAEFLQQEGGYTKEEIAKMNRTFPPLLELSVQRQLFPKMQFLKHTLGVQNPSESPVPAQYFGARLERILAPRHAFLVHNNLPHGKKLFTTTATNSILDKNRNKTLWQEFLSARQAKQFAALCRSWRQQQQQQERSSNITTTTTTMTRNTITHQQVEAFDALFSRGLMAAARDELVQVNNTWPLEHVNLTAAQLVRLLVQHGAPLQERDHRGVTLLHWACGTGNLPVVKELVHLWPKEKGDNDHDGDCVWLPTERDGATPLHWAAAGSTAREFGCGGHANVCRYLISLVPTEKRREYVNQLTLDGNSALMWASWSGTLETVKLMVRHRADVGVANRNGCTVAHWAASGGNVKVCQYLSEIAGVDFTLPNHGGNTPLTHAVAFGRNEVVAWLRETVVGEESFGQDSVAYNLAQDFVQWTAGGDEQRQQVLQLFEEYYGQEAGLNGKECTTGKALDEDFGLV